MDNLKLTLKDFQVSGVEYALSHNYTLIGDEMRLGKSPQAIATFLNSGCKKLLVICPAYLRTNWKLEIMKWSKKELKIQTIGGAKDILKLDLNNDVFICSFTLAEKLRTVFKAVDMVVIDESHYIKNLEAKRTEAIHQLIWDSNPKRLLLLTGTPFKNRVYELYSLLVLLSYDRSGTNGLDIHKYFPTFEKFCEHFCYYEIKSVPTPYGRKAIKKYFGFKNKEDLKKLLQGKYIRRKYKEVFGDEKDIFTDIVLSERRVKDLEELLKAVRNGEGDDPAYATLKAKNALFKAPLTADHAIAVHHELQEPIIIFTDHIDASKEIAKCLGSYKVFRADGGVSAERRGQYAIEFQKGLYDFAVMTVGSMSAGNDMTRSSYMIFNDIPYVPGDLKQALMRIKGVNQKNQCRYDFIAGSPVDAQINEILRSKQRDLDAL